MPDGSKARGRASRLCTESLRTDAHPFSMKGGQMSRSEATSSPVASQMLRSFASDQISSSARSNRDCGIVSPSDAAVFRLMTSSNLAGCSTGMSPGLAPRKILSTYVAKR